MLADVGAVHVGCSYQGLRDRCSSPPGRRCLVGKSLRPDTVPPDKFMIFGGKNHKQYLGCLSCSEYASYSVFNKYSSYGSQFSDTSIYNRFSQYGSRYSDYSACNPNADDPPVIVDEKGLFYGRLTVSRSHNQSVRDGDLLQWLLSVCG